MKGLSGLGGWVGMAAVGLTVLGGSSQALAQEPAAGRTGLVVRQVPAREARSRDELRQATREAFEKYPPSLGQILRLDPTLLTNDAYLAPYPDLRAFLAQYPEVARSPEYFLGFVRNPEAYAPPSAVERQQNNINNMIEMLSVGAVFGGIAFILLWLIRHLLAHRRWLRSTKIQMDIHNRLMERLQSSEDVRHYLESATTARFFADVPTMVEGGQGSGPINRILLAVTIGLVLSCTGLGVLLVKSLIGATEAAADTMVFFGVIVLSLGVGFGLSAAASFVLSRRFGLLAEPVARPDSGQV